MAVKVGNSWVTEASYLRAKANRALENGDNAPQSTLQALQQQFPGTSFSTNTVPFRASGTNNLAISPNILGQMSRDPEKRLEYEALIMDCVNLQASMPAHLPTGSKIKSQGFVINSDGSLSGWCVTEPSGANAAKRNVVELSRGKKETWLDTLFKSVGTPGQNAVKPGCLNRKT